MDLNFAFHMTRMLPDSLIMQHPCPLRMQEVSKHLQVVLLKDMESSQKESVLNQAESFQPVLGEGDVNAMVQIF